MPLRRDAHDEQEIIDAICAQLLAQPGAYAAPTGYAPYATALWEGEQVRVPPASEAQLRATEAQLGFPLPPFLRALYSRVANGGRGLGPTHVFYGADGGWPHSQPPEGDRTISRLVSRSGWRLHERIEAALMRHPGHFVLSDESPDGFIELADWGCGIAVEVDRYTGRVYLVGYADAIPLDDNEELWLCSIEFLAPSLAEWFRRWLDPAPEDAPHKRRELTADCIDVSGLQEPDLVWRGLYRLDQEAAEPETWEGFSGDELPWWARAVFETGDPWIAGEDDADDVEDVQSAPTDGRPDR